MSLIIFFFNFFLSFEEFQLVCVVVLELVNQLLRKKERKAQTEAELNNEQRPNY